MRSGLFGPPLCGGSAPATPPANNMPHRPCVDIGDGCLIESVWPDHVPPVPRRQHGGILSSPSCLPCISPEACKRFQPPLARIPRQTVPTPKLECSPCKGAPCGRPFCAIIAPNQRSQRLLPVSGGKQTFPKSVPSTQRNSIRREIVRHNATEKPYNCFRWWQSVPGQPELGSGAFRGLVWPSTQNTFADVGN